MDKDNRVEAGLNVGEGEVHKAGKSNGGEWGQL